MQVGIFTDTNIMEKGIDAIVQTGGYKNREAVLQEAFMLFLQTYPEHRLMMAVRLYQDGLLPLKRATEISGLPPSDFEDVLQDKGIMSAEESFQQGWQETMADDTRPISELFANKVSRRKWREIAGTATYPLVGEDAQDWVSQTRLEDDQERLIPLTLLQKRQIVDQLCGSWANDNSLEPIFAEIQQQRLVNTPREVSFDTTP